MIGRFAGTDDDQRLPALAGRVAGLPRKQGIGPRPACRNEASKAAVGRHVTPIKPQPRRLCIFFLSHRGSSMQRFSPLRRRRFIVAAGMFAFHALAVQAGARPTVQAFAGAQGAAPAGLCEQGRRQSPIDIVAPLRMPLPTLQFDYRAAPLRLVNDGHTVRVRFANRSRLVVGAERYTLQQFHFHLPAGDRIAGEAFAMGMHFTHKSASGQLMTLVLLFRVGSENPVLAALLPHLPAPGQPERTVPRQTVDAAAWLPAQHGYFAYDGSLTGPPCTEGVRWMVVKQPLQLSAAQLARLKSLIPDNARPVQPLNGRRILESE